MALIKGTNALSGAGSRQVDNGAEFVFGRTRGQPAHAGEHTSDALYVDAMAQESAGLTPLTLLQQPQRVHAVDGADERRVNAVAEHAADVIGDRSSGVARY